MFLFTGYQQACRSSLTAPYRASRLVSLTSFHESNVVSQFSGFLTDNKTIPDKKSTKINPAENNNSEINITDL